MMKYGYATWNNGETIASLVGENEWLVTVNGERDVILERNIKEIYADRLVYRGPSDGFYGAAVLEDLANSMGGTFVYNGSMISPNLNTVY